MKLKHTIFAAVLVLIGGILLLSNLNIISLEIKLNWENIYPILMFVLGVKLWLDSLFKQQGGSWIAGSFLTVFGSLLLLDRFHIIQFTFGDVIELWPLLFVYIGFSLFLSGTKRKHKFKMEYNTEAGPVTVEQKTKSSHMIVGSQDFKKDNWKVEPMDLWNGVGDYQFDFTRAFIPDQDTPISVRGWVGDVKMTIPKNVPFRVEANIKTGDIKIAGHETGGLKREFKYETEDYSDAVRRLTIFIEYKVGSIRIDHV